MPADPKQGKRIIDKSAIERKMMDELECRACGPNGTGRLEAHHLVNRSQLGDDVPANIVGLCPVCHFTFTHEGGNSAKVVARRIRSNMSQSERGYIIRKKSFEWLEQHYPRFEASDRTGWPVDRTEGERELAVTSNVTGTSTSPVASSPSGGSGSAITGADPEDSEPAITRPSAVGAETVGKTQSYTGSDSSAEPRTREGREGHPSVLVSSADKPEGVEQPEMAAPPSGAGLSPNQQKVIADIVDRDTRVGKLSEAERKTQSAARTSVSESIPTVTPFWLKPGKECPTCHNRIPHKKKKTSPTSAVHSFRGPIDEKDSTKEIVEAAAQHTGVGTERPFWKHEWVIRSAADQLAGPPGTLARKPL